LSLERLGEERTLIHLLLVKVTVESHGDVADENSAERGYANVLAGQNDEAFLAHSFQAE
jgi:hypothetical protein